MIRRQGPGVGRVDRKEWGGETGKGAIERRALGGGGYREGVTGRWAMWWGKLGREGKEVEQAHRMPG